VFQASRDRLGEDDSLSLFFQFRFFERFLRERKISIVDFCDHFPLLFFFS